MAPFCSPFLSARAAAFVVIFSSEWLNPFFFYICPRTLQVQWRNAAAKNIAPKGAPVGWQCVSPPRGSLRSSGRARLRRHSAHTLAASMSEAEGARPRSGSRRMPATVSGNYSKPQGLGRRHAIGRASRTSSHAGACVTLTVAGIRLLLLRAMRRPKTANVIVQHLNNRSYAGRSSKSQMGDMIEGDMIRIDYFKATVCSLLS